MAYLEYFDPRILALQNELQYHPRCMELVATHGASEFETRIAEIAAYCGVILDGVYDQEDLMVLAEKLTAMMYQQRTQLILPTH